MISELASCLCMHAWLGNEASDLLLKKAMSWQSYLAFSDSSGALGGSP